MINFIKQKNDMKKLAYIVITSSMFLTTSCVDLTQEPQSFITAEEYIARMDLTSLQQATTGLYNDLWNGNYGFNCRLQRIDVYKRQTKERCGWGPTLAASTTSTPSTRYTAAICIRPSKRRG